jgi:peptide methionine sulfoxide reductase MsrA
LFFQIHDPTTKNRQGNDVGPSYRSAIFYTSPKQKRTAAAKRGRDGAATLKTPPDPVSRMSGNRHRSDQKLTR